MAVLGGVGSTALGVARLRAEETERSDRLVEDPYAAGIVVAAARAGSAEVAWSSLPREVLAFFDLLADQVAVRTRFLDRALLDALPATGDLDGTDGTRSAGGGQVVLLGCGMDTRAFRLDWPTGTRVFEVDFADVLAVRDAALVEQGATARCERVPVGVDLREEWPSALAAAGLDPRRPTAWLAEGLLYALPPAAADLLLDRVTALSAPGSVLAFDQITDSPQLRAARAQVAPELVDLWQGGPSDLHTWLTARRWRPLLVDLRDEARRAGRPVPDQLAGGPGEPARAWLGTATLDTTTPDTTPGTAISRTATPDGDR